MDGGRKKLRVDGFDYSSDGGYFITICTKNREERFGDVIDGEMILNEYGKIIEQEILKTEQIRKEIIIDEFVIMPNHIHMIVFIDNEICVGNINDSVGNNCVVPGPMQLDPTDDLNFNRNYQLIPKLMKGLKSSIIKKINDVDNHLFFGRQKSYYDRIIRNEIELNKIREYILNNPLKRDLDKYNLEN